MQFLSTNEVRYYEYNEKYIPQFLTENETLYVHMKVVIHKYY